MKTFLGVLLLVVVVTSAAILLPGDEPPSRYATAVMGEKIEILFLLDEKGATVERPPPADKKATVIWFWSSKCGCVSDCEARIRTLLERYENKDVAFLAIDSNPDDTREEIEALRKKLKCPYPVDRDANGMTMRRLGIKASASVAVLDGENRLRFRGAIDDDLYRPTVSYVHRAVDAILAGKDFEPDTARSYGCLYPVQE